MLWLLLLGLPPGFAIFTAWWGTYLALTYQDGTRE